MITIQYTPFLPHYLAQSDGLAADRQGQGDTRLTLAPSVVRKSIYVIVVSDWNCLKYFCMFLYRNHQVHRDFWSPCMIPAENSEICNLWYWSLSLVRLPLLVVVNLQLICWLDWKRLSGHREFTVRNLPFFRYRVYLTVLYQLQGLCTGEWYMKVKVAYNTLKYLGFRCLIINVTSNVFFLL
jgi:hypothetical protein